ARAQPNARGRALAANTVRKLRDPRAFLNAAEAALGHAIEGVSGREEARLTYLGVAHAQPAKPGQRRLVIDIGGGSTEFIIGSGFEPIERESLQDREERRVGKECRSGWWAWREQEG